MAAAAWHTARLVARHAAHYMAAAAWHTARLVARNVARHTLAAALHTVCLVAHCNQAAADAEPARYVAPTA